MSRIVRSSLAVVTTCAAAALPAQPISGGAWTPFTGCWRPVGAEAVSVGRDGATPTTLCITPIGSGAAVVARYAGASVVAADTIDPSRARTRRDDDCDGTETATWSASGGRLYRHGTQACGGAGGAWSGLLGLSPEGDLLDVRTLREGTRATAVVQRFTPAAVPAGLEGVVPSAGGSRRDARALAGAEITGADIAEASGAIDSLAVAAWLAERGQGFALDRRAIERLADARLPGVVIDMMVALSFPQKFTLERPSASVALRPPAPTERPAALAEAGRWGGARNAWGVPWGGAWSRWGAWDPFWGDPLAFGAMGWGPWGIGGMSPLWLNQLGAFGGPAWGRGWGGGWSPWWGGGWGGGWGGPVVIGNGSVVPERRGRVVNGRGYDSDGAGGSGSAVPRGRGAEPSRTSWGDTWGGGGGGRGSVSGSGGYSSGGGGASGGGSSGGGERTAKPRPPEE